MTQKTFIEIYKIDPVVCDKIIGLYEINKHLAQPGKLGGNPRIDKSMKDSMDLCVPVSLYGSFVPFFELLQTHVSAYIDKYYFDMGAVGMGPVGYSKYSSLQRYEAGGGYPALHCERDSLQNAQRALVWMLYLTDTPNGGTEFPHQGLTTECIKGDLLLWPTDMSHLHRGVVSQTHEKMIFTGWIDFIQPPSPETQPGQ